MNYTIYEKERIFSLLLSFIFEQRQVNFQHNPNGNRDIFWTVFLKILCREEGPLVLTQ